MALWSDESAFPGASRFSDAELLELAISSCACHIDVWTDMMLQGSRWSDVIALESRNFLVRCSVMHFQLRNRHLERSEVWSMLVELKALHFEHLPLFLEELRRAKAEQRSNADDEIDVDDSGEDAEQRDDDDEIAVDDSGNEAEQRDVDDEIVVCDSGEEADQRDADDADDEQRVIDS